MSRRQSVAVIGCGIFGAMAALRLSEKGFRVAIYDRLHMPLGGASYNNQNRLHLGFHYPRDEETAEQCTRGFKSFINRFKPCIKEGFQNAYFISDSGSLTSAEEYVNFCDKLNLPYQKIDPGEFHPRVENVELGIITDEVVYDCHILRKLIEEELYKSEISLRLNQPVSDITRSSGRYSLTLKGSAEASYDAVINCTYADINRLTHQLGHAVPEYQYEYTMVPIVDWGTNVTGITVMDGDFMTILPFGKTGHFLLYHVNHSVVERVRSDQIPQAWLDKENAPSKGINEEALFGAMLKECSHFVPSLSGAHCVGFLEGPRVIVSGHEKTDMRPSIITQHEPRYISVFSGKIDHSIWVADDLTEMLEIGFLS